MKTCITCGMPFEGNHVNDVGLETMDGPVCVYDAENGAIKSVEDIFNGGVEFFASSAAAGDRALAERLTRTNMNSLTYWKNHPAAILGGPEATPEEFVAAMAKL